MFVVFEQGELCLATVEGMLFAIKMLANEGRDLITDDSFCDGGVSRKGVFRCGSVTLGTLKWLFSPKSSSGNI